MHIRNDPSFFLTNRTGAPHGDELGDELGLASEEHKEDIQSSSVVESSHCRVFCFSFTMKELLPHFTFLP
ncbi:hypothetical protein Tco_0274652, partial [Tanacetum coccineum]